MYARDRPCGLTLRKLLMLTLLIVIVVSYAGPAVTTGGNQILGGGTQRETHEQVSNLKASLFAPLALQSGLTGYGSLNSTGDSNIWYIDVEAGAYSMRSVLTYSSPSADFDLYGGFGYQPTPTYYDWAGTAAGGEDVYYFEPYNGRWYITVYSFKGNGSYSLTVTIDSTPRYNTIFTVFAFLGIGASVFILIMVVAVRRRLSTSNTGMRQTYRQPGIPRSDAPALETAARRVSTAPVMKCVKCGASSVGGEDYCWNCGTRMTAPMSRVARPANMTEVQLRRGVCMVCGLSLSRDDEMLSCPHCGNLAHRNHLLEWLHVKDYCPLCRRHLDQRDLSV